MNNARVYFSSRRKKKHVSMPHNLTLYFSAAHNSPTEERRVQGTRMRAARRERDVLRTHPRLFVLRTISVGERRPSRRRASYGSRLPLSSLINCEHLRNRPIFLALPARHSAARARAPSRCRSTQSEHDRTFDAPSICRRDLIRGHISDRTAA